jgi:hypothetical protein
VAKIARSEESSIHAGLRRKQARQKSALRAGESTF